MSMCDITPWYGLLRFKNLGRKDQQWNMKRIIWHEPMRLKTWVFRRRPYPVIPSDHNDGFVEPTIV